jgi:hypothetical protein
MLLMYVPLHLPCSYKLKYSTSQRPSHNTTFVSKFSWLPCCSIARFIYFTTKAHLCVVRQNGVLCRFGTAGAVRMWEYLHSVQGLTWTVAVTCRTGRPPLSSRHSLRIEVTKIDTVFCRQWNVKYCFELSNYLLIDFFCLLVCMGVRLGWSYWGRNATWGCSVKY